MSRTSPTSAKRAWSYKAGEKGRNRVRVFEWTGGIWIDYRDTERRHRKPLGHSDRAQAKRLADEVAVQLGALDPIGVAAAASPLTVGTLFDMYEREVTPAKAASTQRHDRRALEMARSCWGAGTRVLDLDRRHWDRFILQRRQGALSPHQVRDGAIENDLRLIRAVFNWAMALKANGKPLLAFDPFRGCTVPTELNPWRPSISEEEYQRLRDVAPRVHPMCPLFLVLAHETGHRGASSIGRLRWSDIDFEQRQIRWRGENDKVKSEHTAPMSVECEAALKAARRQLKAIGDGFVFASARDPRRGIIRFQIKYWWHRLEALAGLGRVKGRGWHSLRRKFHTEHQDLPDVERMALLGLRSSRTLNIYAKPRDENMRQALARRTELRRANG